jgi:hypothetical protein
MANANVFLSPGVFTREFDLSFRPREIPAVGAAIVGPTVRGRAFVPTPISTYSEYIRWYGDIFTSGSGASERNYKYLTTYTVQEYLRGGGKVCTVVRVLAGSYGPAYSNVISSASQVFNAANTASATWGQNDMSFKLIALSDGDISNSGRLAAAVSGSGVSAESGTNNLLLTGSAYNMRWEVANVDTSRGVFDLYIRRGDDIESRKIVLEQYNQISLDPNDTNYIGRVIGDQVQTLRYDSSGAPYLELSGSFPNKSRFVRVENIKNTLRYLNANGTIRDGALSGSLPAVVSGTFAGGSEGNVVHPRRMYEEIINTNTQGFNLGQDVSGSTAYADAIDILSNTDQWDIDLLFTPGLIDNFSNHSTLITRGINMVEDRGNTFYVIDPTYKGSTVGQAQNAADGRNTNYAAYYYPWCQVADPDIGRPVWLPPSCVVAGVYSFNDLVAHPWYAPAGLNRGTLDTVIQTERFMTKNDRDNLYIKNINPIATFTNQGITIWGQKTLQKKQSALDRINVRRLLIDAKRFVSYTVKYLVFENNTAQTRARFLELTDPYFRRVRDQQGLYDYRIIIDESNNTPDVIDRNEMRCQIYLKPAKTAEFIFVDFIILPTGALFPTDVQK